ncbi:MAG TPA: dephospho-CoA kinase, partial [Rheinheimera sp.]|nr:dephospho-CoA kinase [Rheinheimera sp.]
VVAPGSPCLNAITEHFGPDILLENGELNRSVLRQKVFSNTEDKDWLNNLLHPAIRQRILTELSEVQSAYAILVAPLLLENGLEQYVQRVLVIDVPESVQVRRTLARDNTSEEQVKAIMAAQLPRQERLKRADDVIANDSSVADLTSKVAALHQQYLQMAAR